MTASDATLTELLQDRIVALNNQPVLQGKPFVLLWLQGQRRVKENVAFAHAQRRANELGRPLVVYEGLRHDYPHASERFHRFVLEGVRDTARDCAAAGVAYAFFLETPDSPRGVLHALAARAALLVTDWLPSFIHPAQTKRLADRAPCRVEAVDAAGAVALAAFPKAELAARTLRSKLHKRLFLHAVPQIAPVKAAPRGFDWGFEPLKPPINDAAIDAAVGRAGVSRAVPGVGSAHGGRSAGLARLHHFLQEKLPGYAEDRNNPDSQKPSWLSPYLHFGHVGSAEIALAAQQSGAPSPDVDAFVEELLVRRELSLNFVARTRNSDSIEALPGWAQQTLAQHARDPRTPVSLEELEAARSPDALWNAAQRQLVGEGRIHGYLRMLWGKLLLHWSRDAAETLERMTYLNDKYALDGRDAVSRTNYLWCLGLHDRPFPERPVFGTVRSMTSASAMRKLDLKGYLARWGEPGQLVAEKLISRPPGVGCADTATFPGEVNPV